ncbi:MAG: SH3 domain-containing protein [Pseudobdellovibrio sp.]
MRGLYKTTINLKIILSACLLISAVTVTNQVCAQELSQKVSKKTAKVRRAKVVNPETEVYKAADFDSDVVRTVSPNEMFLISSRTYGPFYRVKFNDGTFGFIADTELDIEGVGTFKARPYVEDENLKQIPEKSQDEEDGDDNEPKLSYKGVSLHMVNYHEDTMGRKQVADMLAYGFRFQPMSGNYDSSLAYDVMIAPQAPDYYSDKTGHSASGAIIWGSVQISNTLGLNRYFSARYGAGPFAKLSYFNVQTNVKKYALQDLTLGLDFQAGLMLHTRYTTIDLGLRYFWDKESYGALGVAFLF